MAGEKFKLNFINDGFGIVTIDEPIGYSSLSWDFKQKEKGYGRDILFNGGEAQLDFTDQRNHYVDKLIYYNHHFGYESKVELIIEFSNGLIVTHDLDFKGAQTDDYKYFKCKMIQQSDILLAKRKSGTKVDLFSNKDIYDNDIDPVSTTKILMQPKAVIQRSKLQQVQFEKIHMEAKGNEETEWFQANPCQIMAQDDVQNTLISLLPYDHKQTPSNYYILEAENKLTDTTIVIPKGLYIKITTGTANGGTGYVDFSLSMTYGADQKTGVKEILMSKSLDTDRGQSYEITTTADISRKIKLLERGDRVWLYFEWKVRQSVDFHVAPKSYADTTIRNMEINISATSSSTSTVVEGVRLIDAMKQIILSISGKSIDAPMFDVGTLYYNTFLLNGNLLRKIPQKAFSVSLDDLADSITECNADYEIGDAVFFGSEREFYTSNECGFFDTIQFKNFNKTTNERMAINEFSFRYKKYQALKENELPQTADTVHGESILSLFNKNVENRKEIMVEWTRDSFLLEEARNKGLILSNDTAYQDDDNIFALDTIIQAENIKYRDTAELRHEYFKATNILNLQSSTVNFALMGIEANSQFTILEPDDNAGTYNIISVTPNTLDLTPLVAKPTVNNNGVRKTAFEYTINSLNVPLKNYTTEDIINIVGINDAHSYSNLRFSVKRNMVNYYQDYLTTCNQYWKGKPIKTTWYKNNRDFGCTLDGISTLEGESFIPVNQILTPNVYKDVVFANVSLEDFFTLINKLRTLRGFVRTIDKNNNVIKLYPTMINYKILERELTMIGEEKFEPSQMTISTANTEIEINGETAVHQLDYKIMDNKLFIYDMNRQLLYNGVFWDKVAINGYVPENQDELNDLMKLIQSKNN